jgi:hypothetical protein
MSHSISLFCARLTDAYYGTQYTALMSKRHAGWSNFINVTLTAITLLSGFSLLVSQLAPKESQARSYISITAGVMVLLSEALRQLNTKVFEHDKKAAALARISEKLHQSYTGPEVTLTKVLRGELTEDEIDKASELILIATTKAWTEKPNAMHFRESKSCRQEASNRTSMYFKNTYNFTSTPL